MSVSKSKVRTIPKLMYWFMAIVFWPIFLAIFLLKKSKNIKRQNPRNLAIISIVVLGLIVTFIWFWALSLGSRANNSLSTPDQATTTSVDSANKTDLSKTDNVDQNSSKSSSTPQPEVASIIGSRTKTSNCKITNALPDKACTPGAIFSNATKDQICVSGYSSSVRDVSDSTKKAVYAEYGITSHTTGQYEVDHLVSLELGGSNDIANLWPEPANPTPGFHQKDSIENSLHAKVCDGIILLSVAQDEIAGDWLALYSGTTPTSTTPTTSGTTPPLSSGTTAQSPTSTTSGVVKLSTTGICHVPGDQYYDKTTNYTGYDTLQACINAGGRASK